MWDGTHNIKHDDTAEAMTGPFMWDLVYASMGHVFSVTSSRTLESQEIITAHKLWTRLNTSPTADRALEPLGRRPRPNKGCSSGPKSADSVNVACSRTKEGGFTLACQKSPWRSRTRDRDSFARQIRRMGGTADMERAALQRSKSSKKTSMVQWLDRRPTAVANVEEVVRFWRLLRHPG